MDIAHLQSARDFEAGDRAAELRRAAHLAMHADIVSMNQRDQLSHGTLFQIDVQFQVPAGGRPRTPAATPAQGAETARRPVRAGRLAGKFEIEGSAGRGGGRWGPRRRAGGAGRKARAEAGVAHRPGRRRSVAFTAGTFPRIRARKVQIGGPKRGLRGPPSRKRC